MVPRSPAYSQRYFLRVRTSSANVETIFLKVKEEKKKTPVKGRKEEKGIYFFSVVQSDETVSTRTLWCIGAYDIQSTRRTYTYSPVYRFVANVDLTEKRS